MGRFIAGLSCVLLACAPASAGPARGPADAAGVRHVIVSCDLDTAESARRVTAELSDAAAGGATAVVLELTANAWRADTVLVIAEAVRGAGPTVVVYLRDPEEGRVGAGPVLVGLAADGCWIDPRTKIRVEPGDDRRDLAPDDIDWARVTGDLLAAIEPRAGRADDRVIAALVRPESPLWVVAGVGDGPAAFYESDPPPGARPITERGADGFIARFDPADAVRLGLCDGESAAAGDLCRSAGLEVSGRVVRRVDGGLASAESAIRDTFGRIDSLPVTIRDWRTRGSSADRRRELLDLLAQADKALAGAEELAAAYPELLRRPAPGESSIDASTPSKRRTAWKSAFDARRKLIDSQRKSVNAG